MKDSTDKSLLEHYTGLAMQSLIQRGDQLPINPKEAVTIAAGVVKALREHTSEDEKQNTGNARDKTYWVHVDNVGEKISQTLPIIKGQTLFWRNSKTGVVKVRAERTSLGAMHPSYAVGGSSPRRFITVSYAEGMEVKYEDVDTESLYEVDKVLRPCPPRVMERSTVNDLYVGGIYFILKKNLTGGIYWADVQVIEILQGYMKDPWLKILVESGDGEQELVSAEDLFYDPENHIS